MDGSTDSRETTMMSSFYDFAYVLPYAIGLGLFLAGHFRHNVDLYLPTRKELKRRAMLLARADKLMHYLCRAHASHPVTLALMPRYFSGSVRISSTWNGVVKKGEKICLRLRNGDSDDEDDRTSDENAMFVFVNLLAYIANPVEYGPTPTYWDNVAFLVEKACLTNVLNPDRMCSRFWSSKTCELPLSRARDTERAVVVFQSAWRARHIRGSMEARWTEFCAPGGRYHTWLRAKYNVAD